MENVQAISIDTGNAQSSVKKLKEDISKLRDEILNLTKGTDEYDRAVKALQDNQRRYNEVMSLTKKESVALEGSYDALVHQMSLLKKEWRATNDELKRNELGKQIDEINTSLKEFDASVGNHQRNVGNYTEGVVDAFAQLKQEVKDARNALLQAEEGTEEYADAMKRLSDAQFQLRDMNEQSRYAVADFGEQLSNVVGITQGVVAGFSAYQSVMILAGVESEEFEKVMVKLQATMALVQGLQGLEGLIDRVKGFTSVMKLATKAIGTGGWLGIIAVATTALAGFLMYWNKTRQEVDTTTQAINDFNTSLKDNIEFETEDIAVIKAYNEIATDVNETIENRTLASEKLLTALGLEITEQNKQKALYGELTSDIDNYIAKIKEQAIEKIALAQVEDLVTKQMQLQMEIMNLETDKQTTKGSFWDRFWYGSRGRDKTIERIDDDIDEKRKQIDDLNTQIVAVIDTAKGLGANFLDDNEEVKPTTSNNSSISSTTTTTKSSTSKSSTLPLKLFDVNTIKENLAEYNQAIKDEEINAINQNIEEIINTYDIAIREKLVNGENPFDLQIEKIRTQIATLNELILNTDDADERARLMWEKANLELDILEQTNEEKERLRKEDEENEKQHQDNLYQLGMASMSAVSDVLNGIADLYESDDEKSQQYAEQIKALRISTAVIDTIQGALGAFMQASATIPPPFGQIIGGIQAGAITAVGMMNIAKIKNTKVGDKNASTDSNFNSSQVTPNASYTQSNPFEYTRNVTTASEYEELNKDSRVILVESDLTNALRKVQIRQNETSF
jgi:hypothetical protein